MPSTCPNDDELLRWIDGDPDAAGLRGHLDGCPRCREHLARLKAAAQALRRFAVGAVLCNGEGLAPTVTPSLPSGGGGITMSEDSGRDEGDGTTGSGVPEPQPAAIGKYPVVERLGRGGQAVVYRGIHPTLHVDVAIKVGLRPLVAGRIDPGELEREGKALAGLEHPNLLRLYDLDVDAAGRPFLVMELVRGRNLRQHAEQVRPDPRVASLLVAAVARGAAAAHQQNLIHLDIKPENILIDEAGRPRLIDFGLARLRDAWAEEAGPSGGTLAFMAPEQARGEAVDARGDIFALGGVLYSLLTGTAPFAGRDRGEALNQARRCDFDRSALRAARVPRRLERICLRAMAADPADRYTNADDLASALEQFARPRRRSLATVALAAALLAAVGVAIRTTSSISQDTSKPPIEGQRVELPPPPIVPLRITKMEILHYRQNQGLGRIGVDSFAGRYQDDRASANFRQPW